MSWGFSVFPARTLVTITYLPSAEPKYRFAELAPDLIKADGGLRKPLEGFLGEVLAFVGA